MNKDESVGGKIFKIMTIIENLKLKYIVFLFCLYNFL